MAGQGGQGLPPPQQRWKAGRMAMKMPVAGRPAGRGGRQPALVLAVCSFPPSFPPSFLPSFLPSFDDPSLVVAGRRSRSSQSVYYGEI